MCSNLFKKPRNSLRYSFISVFLNFSDGIAETNSNISSMFSRVGSINRVRVKVVYTDDNKKRLSVFMNYELGVCIFIKLV